MSAANEVGTGAASAAGVGIMKSMPPVAVSGLSLAGVQLQDWVYIATLVWIVIQAGWFVWTNIIKPRRKTRPAKRSRVFRDDA